MRHRKKQTAGALLLLILILSLILSGCAPGDAARFKDIAGEVRQVNTELSESFNQVENEEDLLDILISFADENQLYYYRTEDGKALILVKQPVVSGGSGEFTIHTSLTASDPKRNACKTAIVFSVLKHAENQKKIIAVFTVGAGRDPGSIESVPAAYFSGANFLSLDYGKSAVLSGAAGLYTHTFTKETVYEPLDSEDRRTYRVAVMGLSGTLPEDPEKTYYNPIKPIYDILSYCEDNHLDYRLISVKSEDSLYGYPTTCTMLLSLNVSDVTKFRNRVDKVLDKYEEKVSEDQPNFRRQVIVMTTGEETALSSEEAKSVLSMLYTITEHYDYLSKDDEGNKVGQAYLMDFNLTRDEGCRIGVATCYPNEAGYLLARDTFSGLAELNKFTYQSELTIPPYAPATQLPAFRDYLTCQEIARFDTGETTLPYPTACNLIQRQNSQACVIGLQTNEEDIDRAAETLIRYAEAER